MATAADIGARGPPSIRSPDRADLLAVVDAMVRREVLSPDRRSHALLLYLIDHHLAGGPDEPVKAYAIAVDVLGRGSDFDPAEDSIVRVEIGRLRKLLEMYAQGPGRTDPLRLDLPRGQSHLVVSRQSQAHPIAPARTTSRRDRVLWLAGAAAAGLLGFLMLQQAFAPPIAEAGVAEALDPDYPRVFVRTLDKDGPTDAAYPESALARYLAQTLSGWRSFRVIAPDPPTSLPVRPRDYVLDGTAAIAGPGLELNLRLRDGTGAVLWTDRLVLGDAGSAAAPEVLAALTDVAATLGGAMGVIDADGRARLTAEGAAWDADDGSAFRCYLRWQSADLTKDPQEADAARACLSLLADQDTPVGQIWAAIAFQRYLDWSASGTGTDDPRLTAALAAANRAVLIDPAGPDGYGALGSILTGLGRHDDARAALARALDLNPSNLDTVVKLGWLDALQGDWEKGTQRIRKVADRFAVVPGWYRLPLAMDALRRDDAVALREDAVAMVATGDRRGLVLGLAAAGLSGDGAAATQLTADLAAAGITPAEAVARIGAVFPDADLIEKLSAAAGVP